MASQGGSRRGSQPGSPARSAGSPGHSRPASQSGQGNFPTPLGYDPAKPQNPAAPENKGNTRLDLPPEAYLTPERLQNAGNQSFAKRPGFNKSGVPVPLEVNQYRVKKWSDASKIYQFDISVSPVHTKPHVIFKKCWAHEDVQERLAKYNTTWISDGRKLAWSTGPINRGEERIRVDLDKGRPPRRDGKRPDNTFFVVIRQTAEVNLAVLDAYLRGQIDWDNKVLECMNFLDHVVRQGSSEKLVQIKRNFYPPANTRNGQQFLLNNCVELIKGVYASVRMNQAVVNGLGGGLGLNVDVANTAFWCGGQSMIQLVKHYVWMAEPKLRGKEISVIADALKPIKRTFEGGQSRWGMSETFKLLRRLNKLHFTVSHRGKDQNEKDYIIQQFEFAEKYGAEGAIPRNVMIDDREKPGRKISLFDYFLKRYGVRITHHNMPMILTSRAGLFPLDVCTVKPMQRFPYKLDSESTAMMIKGAVTRPDKRRADIIQSKDLLALDRDEYLQKFNIHFEPNMARTEGRLLQSPLVQYKNGAADPKTSGRWDLRGKKFWEPNPVPLRCWGILILEKSCRGPEAQQFINTFKQVYVGHGGKVESDAIVIDEGNNNNAADALARGINQVRHKNNGTPVQILFCVIRFANSGNYERLKKSADCRFAVLTQVVLSKHVEKNQAQYHSNVAMKVNAKLGGTTCRVPHPNKAQRGPPFFSEPTAIIGADVSHTVPGVNAPSTAAMTMSQDMDACRYAAAVETNGYRVEMISPINMNGFLSKLVPLWQRNLKSQDPPRHIYYFRDGVSEGQFAHVLEIEVSEMKRYFKAKHNGKVPKFTVIVATKRHHIRFFPQKGDKNKNPFPGTLVETEVCHPFQWDFYLCSHSAIQGTARPVHYHVLLDEAKVPSEKLQLMIYQQCYQYARSTTPVSLHPAVYYADLACGRARTHENVQTSDGFRTGPKAAEIVREFGHMEGFSMGGPVRGTESAPLLPMGGPEAVDVNKNLINSTMWYI